MSQRTLIEINHDYSFKLDAPTVRDLLQRYLASGSREDAEALEPFGIRVIGMRHHADKYIIDGRADGFPPIYLTPPATA